MSPEKRKNIGQAVWIVFLAIIVIVVLIFLFADDDCWPEPDPDPIPAYTPSTSGPALEAGGSGGPKS